MKKKLIVVGAIAVIAALSWTCSPVYLLRAGYHEAKILARRQPIVDMLRNPDIPAETREKLALVLQARDYAERVLELDTGDSYTLYSRTDGDTLAIVLSAARKDRFEKVTWWFPIVGHVPYRGYFNPRAAERAAERMERRGYDTYLRPIAAFSTLGWFNDPLLSTLLRHDEVPLVNTVIHELTHNSLYLPGQAAFNESFATFVGGRGAIDFFCELEGEDGPRCIQARDAWADDLLFGRFRE
jgi:predicted aminopeptidase